MSKRTSMVDLETAISDVRTLAWISANLHETFVTNISRDQPGVHVMTIDAQASDAMSWCVMELDQSTKRLAEVFFGREVAAP